MRRVALLLASICMAGCASLYEPESLPALVPISAQKDIVSESYHMTGQEDVIGASFWQKGDEQHAILLSSHYIGHYLGDRSLHGADLEKAAISQPVQDGSLTYFTNEANELVAFNHERGGLEWRLLLEHIHLSTPVIAGKHIYLQSQDGSVIAIAKSSRKVVWTYSRKMPVLTIQSKNKPMIDGKTVYAGFADGYLVSLNANSGELQWEKRMATPRGRTEIARLLVVHSPSVLENSLVVSAYHGALTRITKNGKQIYWREKVSSKLPVYLSGEQVLVLDEQNNFQAYALDNGELKWHQPLLRRRKPTVLAHTSEYAWIGDGYGYVHLMRMDDGELLGRVALESRAQFNLPAQWDGTNLITVSSKGTFHRLSIQDMEEIVTENKE